MTHSFRNRRKITKTNETRKCLDREKCCYSNNRMIKNINNMEKMIEELGNIKNEQ